MDTILIIDYGSQVTKLIARRVRECGVYCEIFPFNKADAAVKLFQAEGRLKGIILSGGPASVTRDDAPRAPEAIFSGAVPVLGICYGQQLMCAQNGGSVSKGKSGEFGSARLHVVASSPLFNNINALEEGFTVWMSHGDKVTALPEGFAVIAQSEGAPYAAIEHREKRFYGVQFHPEVTHTENGKTILDNFVKTICGCAGDWTMAKYREEAIAKLREQIGDAKVICGLSGGVDSAVAALMIHEAVGDQLTCIFVDHGLLRLNEAETVTTLFREHYDIPLICVNAEERFLTALAGVSDPEKKRKIIGGLFIDVFEEEAKKLGGAEFLGQGTRYPDVIESANIGGGAVTIKSHHNVGGLPERMNMRLAEPLRELFKDEVRALGRELGLPEIFIGRHPFPGPGLAVRIPGAVTKQACDTLRLADAIYIDEIRKAGLYDDIWQAFAVLLPVRSVGVMGDGRTYENACALRAVTSSDGMTADVYPFEHAFLTRTATRIINETPGVNRVTYDLTSKPPGTIEWE